MSTRSNIGLKKKDGTVEVIYCHWDGYLSGNGQILLDNYELDEVREILSRGDMSSLGESPDGCHFYNGGEEGEARSYNSLEEYFDAIKDDIFMEYAYIYDEETGTWLVAMYEDVGDNYEFGKFRELTKALIEEKGD